MLRAQEEEQMNNLEPRSAAGNLVRAVKEGLVHKPMHFTMFGAGVASCILFNGFLFFCGAVVVGATIGTVIRTVVSSYNADY